MPRKMGMPSRLPQLQLQPQPLSWRRHQGQAQGQRRRSSANKLYKRLQSLLRRRFVPWRAPLLGPHMQPRRWCRRLVLLGSSRSRCRVMDPGAHLWRRCCRMIASLCRHIFKTRGTLSSALKALISATSPVMCCVCSLELQRRTLRCGGAAWRGVVAAGQLHGSSSSLQTAACNCPCSCKLLLCIRCEPHTNTTRPDNMLSWKQQQNLQHIIWGLTTVCV